MTKGRELAIAGNIRTGSYDAKDGTKRYTTDVIVEGSKFIGGSNTNNSNSNGFDNSNNNGFSSNFADDMVPIDDGDMPF